MKMTEKAIKILNLYGKNAFDSRLMQTDCTQVLKTKGTIFKSTQVSYQLSKPLAMQILSRRACMFYDELLKEYFPVKLEIKGTTQQKAQQEQADKKIVDDRRLLRSAVASIQKMYANKFDTPDYDLKAAGIALLLSQKVKWQNKKLYGAVVGFKCSEIKPLSNEDVIKVKSFIRASGLLMQYNTEKAARKNKNAEPCQ